jgi:hypothetical protein
VISNFTFDGTSDPMQKAIRDALIGFMAAMGECSCCSPRRSSLARPL